MKAIIIDDEQDCVALLKLQLKMYCPQVEVVAATTDSIEGLEIIKKQTFDVLFLDIEMPRLNGIQLIQSLKEINFAIVFVTAYAQYAVQAFRFSAIDFLLKPVDPKELIDAINKITADKTSFIPQKGQIDFVKEYLDDTQTQAKAKISRIALPYQSGIVFVQIDDIIYCEADNNYSYVFVDDKVHKYVLAKTLKDVQALLAEHEFTRVHRHYLINNNKIKKLMKGEGNYLIMANDKSIPIARGSKHALFEQFGWI